MLANFNLNTKYIIITKYSTYFIVLDNFTVNETFFTFILIIKHQLDLSLCSVQENKIIIIINTTSCLSFTDR